MSAGHSRLLDRLQQPNGLFFHAPDAKFYWSRGNGWQAAGMTELLLELPKNHPTRPRIVQGPGFWATSEIELAPALIDATAEALS